MCLNATCIVNKMGELRLMVEDAEPDIMYRTRPDMGNAEFALKGYQMFRKDREVRRGGGVALYIKQSIPAYAFQIDNVVDCDEAIWCNILIRGAKLTVGVVLYRCPSTSKAQEVILHNVISFFSGRLICCPLSLPQHLAHSHGIGSAKASMAEWLRAWDTLMKP